MKKGISLIVLVITIIVMIIIAGAIIISLSNSNVIDKADQAVISTNDSAAKSLAALAYAEFIGDKGGSSGIDQTLNEDQEGQAAPLVAAINAKLHNGNATGYEVEYKYTADPENPLDQKHQIILTHTKDGEEKRVVAVL